MPTKAPSSGRPRRTRLQHASKRAGSATCSVNTITAILHGGSIMNLVFASGFLVPQHLLGIDYFRGLRDHFAGRHATLFPFVPPMGTAEERALVLADAIAGAYPEGEIHIIAHSMGGLDSRILIARNI